MFKQFFSILIVCFSLACFSQKTAKNKIASGRIIYKVEKVLPPDIMKKVQNRIYDNESIRETLMATYLKTKEVTAILEFNKNTSYYVLSEKDLDDLNDRRNTGFNLSSTLAASKNQYFIDFTSDEKFYKAKNMAMEFELVYFEKPKWKLLDEKKEILGYNCKKAIIVDDKKKKTYAWFTIEIPLSFGPKAYFGLPGLILEIEKGNDVFIAKEIEINPKKIKITKPKANLKTTYKAKLNAFSKIMSEN